MLVVKAPNPIPRLYKNVLRVFLAGSIEMGAAEDWQETLATRLSDVDAVFLNPRRDDWDSSWEQKIDSPHFNKQVTWELDMIESADLVVFYFDKNTKSPITLLELGLVVPSQAAVVYCPDGFWRKGNVDIVCKRYEVDTVNSMDALVTYIRRFVRERNDPLGIS